LADAVRSALGQRANVINISAAQQADLMSLSNELGEALQQAQDADVLVIAAAGNHGCACDTLPASVPGVLAVGAHDDDGVPLVSSNWGQGHRAQGVTAPGRDIAGACVGGGLCRASGTSFAAAVVSGVAGLLMSADVEAGFEPSGSRIRRILLDTSIRPQPGDVELAGTRLTGRLDLVRAVEQLRASTSENAPREGFVSTSSLPEEGADQKRPTAPGRRNDAKRSERAPAPVVETEPPVGLVPAHADCGCGGTGGECTCSSTAPEKSVQLVYAIGSLGVSFVSQSRRDSILRTLNETRDAVDMTLSDEALQALLASKPYLAQSVVWTLSRSEAPMYAVVPAGAFAADTYTWLSREWTDPNVEFVSIPGILAGHMTLYDGSPVNIVVPDLRGMYSWDTERYVQSLRDGWKSRRPGLPDDKLDRELTRFLSKIYFSIRNLGMAPSERAINAAATNAFNFSGLIVEAGEEGMSFRDVSVERSPLNRPGTDCYDILLTFFDPGARLERAALRARFTVDVSDTVPVMVGDPASWYEY
jgi:cyanobactin maturation PatA/PatG family protease